MVVPAVAIGRHRPNASIDRWYYHLTERPRFGVRNQKHQALDSTERLVFLPVSRLIRRSTARTTCWTLVPLSCDGLSKNALVRPLGLLVVGSSEKYCCVPVAYPGARATRDRLQLCRFRASLRCVAPGCHRPDPVAPVRRRLSAPPDPPGRRVQRRVVRPRGTGGPTRAGSSRSSGGSGLAEAQRDGHLVTSGRCAAGQIGQCPGDRKGYKLA